MEICAVTLFPCSLLARQAHPETSVPLETGFQQRRRKKENEPHSGGRCWEHAAPGPVRARAHQEEAAFHPHGPCSNIRHGIKYWSIRKGEQINQ